MCVCVLNLVWTFVVVVVGWVMNRGVAVLGGGGTPAQQMYYPHQAAPHVSFWGGRETDGG